MTLSYTPGQRLRGVNTKHTYQLGSFIAAGGEGRVYALSGQADHVAKLYPEKMSRDRVRRLSATIAASTPSVQSIAAWPEDVLVTQTRVPVGFVMPRVDNSTPLHLLISPSTRLKERPQYSYASLLAISENLCRAVATLHQDNIIIGDINGQNFLVLPNGTVRVIDCDSMQVGIRPKWFPEVNVEDYLPPELQGKRLSKTPRTSSHDVFSLAVVIFQLLIVGRHPFAGADGLELREAIAQRRHAFSSKPPAHNAFKVLGLIPTSVLTSDVIQLFSKTFNYSESWRQRGGDTRPSAMDWVQALSKARQGLQACMANTAHHSTSAIKSCPWCDMEKRGLPPLFVARPTQHARPSSVKTLTPTGTGPTGTRIEAWCRSLPGRFRRYAAHCLHKLAQYTLAALKVIGSALLNAVLCILIEILETLMEFLGELFTWLFERLKTAADCWPLWLFVLYVVVTVLNWL